MTLVPIIGTSDQTHLSNFSGDNKAWPVYITLGNLLLASLHSPESMAVLLLALLPLPSKLSKSTKADQYQRQVNAATLQDVFEFTFALLQHTPLDGVPTACAYGKGRSCFSILSAWVADHLGNMTLHGLKSNASPTCKMPVGKLGTNMEEDRARDYARYERCGYENRFPSSKSDSAHVKFCGLGINLAQ